MESWEWTTFMPYVCVVWIKDGPVLKIVVSFYFLKMHTKTKTLLLAAPYTFEIRSISFSCKCMRTGDPTPKKGNIGIVSVRAHHARRRKWVSLLHFIQFLFLLTSFILSHHMVVTYFLLPLLRNEGVFVREWNPIDPVGNLNIFLLYVEMGGWRCRV